MRAILVVVADVLREQPFQMAFIERDDVIQQVAAAASHPAFRGAILPGAFEGSANRMDAQGANSGRDFQPVLGIAIEEQKPGSGIKGKRFPQLLDDPLARGVFGDVEVQNASAFVADDEEAIEYAERDRRNRKEIHRGDGFLVVTKKGKPALARPRIPRRSFHPAGDGSFGNIEAEHEEFTVDAGSAPGWVLGDHLEDKISNFSRYWRSSGGFPDFRNQLPVPAESSAMPPDHGFGCDNQECLLPSRPALGSEQPEEPVEEIEPRAWMSAFQHRKLLA